MCMMPRRERSLLALLLTCLLAGGVACDPADGRTGAGGSPTQPAAPRLPAPAPDLPPAVGTGWSLVDWDDFAGTSLARHEWSVYRSASTNGVSTWSPSMVSVGGGELRIAGEGKNPSGDGDLSGGLCWCGGDQTYGLWQVRARFEPGRGYGQAILLWPRSDRWPQDGELDFVETPEPAKTVAHATIHWDAGGDEIDTRTLHGDFTAWHVYTVEWRPDRVRMFVDHTLTYDSARSGDHPTIPSTPMHLAIQQEPGPFGVNWVPSPDPTTPDRVTMHIDWVRRYQATAGSGSPAAGP
jgi:beta-glucanase (GH16 family)